MFSLACTNLVKSFEGCRLSAYPDPGTGGDPITIGYGHTGPGVTMGLTIPQSQADAWLQQDLEKANKLMHELINIPLKQCQEDAFATPNTGNIEIDHSSASTTVYTVSGDVELDAKPGFAY